MRRIAELNQEAEVMRQAKEGRVVSLTIENLLKQNVDLERGLEACEGRGDKGRSTHEGQGVELEEF